MWAIVGEVGVASSPGESGAKETPRPSERAVRRDWTEEDVRPLPLPEELALPVAGVEVRELEEDGRLSAPDGKAG